LRRDLLIAAGPGEWRAAWLEDGAAVELAIERGDSPPAGSIHLGRVVRLVGGLDAALVDIGAERPGFLPFREPLNEGGRVIVEVRREAQRGKGALLTTRIADERRATIAAPAARLEPPTQLDPPPGFAAALARRLPGIPEHIVTDDPMTPPELRGAFAGVEIVHAAAADWPLDIDAVFDAALSPSVGLPGGARLHVAETETAVLIDIDTGSPESGSFVQTTAAANLAAVAEIARQIRLRQLGGGIIIDFAALEGRGPRERVRQAMAGALAGDPAQPQVLGWTRLGHLELVRPRRQRSLGAVMLDPQTGQKSPVALAFECLRAIGREARGRPAADWRLVVRPDVAAALRGPAATALRSVEDRLARRLAIETVPASEGRPFDIVPL
jgi:ribonuclease G